MRKGLVAALLALTSCRQLLGLEDPGPTSHPPDGAQQVTVTGSHFARSAFDDLAFAPQMSDIGFSSTVATLIRADGPSRAVPTDSMGQFSVTVDELPYRLVFVDDFGPPIEYQLDSKSPVLPISTTGRYPATTTPAGTTIALTVGNATSGTFLVSVQ